MALLFLLFRALILIVIVDAVSSWFVKSPRSFPRNITGPIVEPMYAPVRRILPPEKTGNLDLAPLVWIFGLQALMSVLH